MFKLIDSHAHLDFPEFKGNEKEITDRAKAAGVFKIINVGVDVKRSQKSIDLAREFKDIVFATVGIHPHDGGKVADLSSLVEDIRNLRNLAKNSEVVAIGECGLDFFRVELNQEKERQKELFIAQIKLAGKIDLPLVVHTREAEKETLEALSSFKNKRSGVIHCFTGSSNFAKELIDLGFYIGFTGIVTFDKTGNLEKIIKEVPLSRILIETDAPFLAPAPYRGKTNEPAFVLEVAKKIAEVKGISLEEVAEATYKNTTDLFLI